MISNNLIVYLKVLQKRHASNHKISRSKEINIRADINETEIKRIIQRFNETKEFFERMNIIDKFLLKVLKKSM
jgi:NADH/NAD ratio-sensing transcriptional regulator Rex